MIDRRIAKIKLRRGTEAERINVLFEEGELVYATDSKNLYIGDGSTYGGLLINNKISISNTNPAISNSGDIFYDQTDGVGYIKDGTQWKMIGGRPDDETIAFNFGEFQLKDGGIKGRHIGEIHTIDGGLSSLSSEGIFINYDSSQFEVVSGVFKVKPSAATVVDPDGAIVGTSAGLSANVDNDTIQVLGNALQIKTVRNEHLYGNITPNKADSTFANAASGLSIDNNGMAIKTLSDDLDFDNNGNLRLNPDQFAAQKSANGYQILPNKFVMQWGQTSLLNPNSSYTVVLPLTTWAVCYNVQVTMSYNSVINNNFAAVIKNIQLSSFDVFIDYSSSTTTTDKAIIYWTAIGYNG